MTEEEEQPDILKPLWSRESVFCANCGHHLNCHDINRVPVCDYDAAVGTKQERGRIECNCKEFVASPSGGI